MFRVALINKLGEHKAENFSNREQADEFILNNEAAKFMIAENGTVIETDKGIRRNE